MVSGFIHIPISKFASCMGYCQYVAINHFLLKIKPRISNEQILGRKVHYMLEKEDKLIPREKATEEEMLNPKVDLDIPRESLRVKIIRNNGTLFLYSGRIDKVVRENGNLIIIDDKVSRKPVKHVFPDRIIQLLGYCEGFIKTFENIRFNKLFFSIIQRNEKKEILSEHKEEYTENLKKDLIRNFNLFENIINKKALPEHHFNPNKCSACSYDCRFRL